MTKKSMGSLVRQIFWYLIILLPLIAYVATCFCDQPNVNFDEFIKQFIPVGSNPVYDLLQYICGSSSSYVALSDSMCRYLAYFVYIELIHVVFDFILFLPRLLHRALDKLSGKGGDT